MSSRDPRFRAGLILVTLIAGIVRFVKLGDVPVALYCDEALGAYEAWSLLLTGRDIHGRILPLFFDIFGIGWAEPLYVYLSVPAVALLGLTNVAARLVAAIAGTLCVAATGLMTRALLGTRVSRQTASFAGLAAAGLMAVSPWAVHFSRIAFQASLLPLTLAAGFWLTTQGAHAKTRRSGLGLLAVGAMVLGLSLYTYPVSRLALPLLVAGFALLQWKSLTRHAGAMMAAALVLAALAAPIAAFSLTPRGQQRFSNVSLTSRADVAAGGAPALMLAAMENYASYFSPGFLLTHGDANPRHSIPRHGMLHPHDVLLGALGLLVAIWLRSAGSLFLVWWLAASPVAASLTVDAGHAVRSIPIQPGVYALAGLGAAAVWSLLRMPGSAGATPGRRRRAIFARALLVVFIAASAASIGVYFHDYFNVYPIHSGPAWQYGLKEAYEYAESSGKSHDSVYVTRNEDYPWIQMLFYRRVSPRDYQATGLAGTRYLFDQEVFYRGADIPGRSNPMFVLKPWEADPRLTGRHVIHYPDGSEAFVIAW